jgi:hypothetical protein
MFLNLIFALELIMLTLEFNNELETELRFLAEREQTAPLQLIEKLLKQYRAQIEKEDFFSYAGLWQDYDITQETLRDKAWRK